MLRQAARRCKALWQEAVGVAPCALMRRHNRRHAATYDLQRTVILSGVPRGGTTWFAELLMTTPDTTLIWEPFMPSQWRDRLRLRFAPDAPARQFAAELAIDWTPHIPEGADWPEAREFFHQLLTGQLFFSSMRQSQFPLRPTRHHLIKFCRANRLLPWMVANFALRPPVYLIRHPCAVVASQLRHPVWADGWQTYVMMPGRYASELHAPYRDFLASLSTPEEVLAARWCLDQLVPLRHPENNRRWITVAYERLLQAGHDEVSRVWGRLGLAVPTDLDALLTRPSAMTREGSPILSGGNQLTGWRKHLSSEQVGRVLATVETFGLSKIYSDALEPNYDRLYAGPALPSEASSPKASQRAA